MGNVAVFRPNKTPQYLKSVNTPDYVGDSEVLINPNVTAIEAVPLKFWKRTNGNIVEMTAGEKQAVTDAELLARKNLANGYGLSDIKVILTALVKVVNIRLPAGQKITEAEMITALKNEIT